MDRRRFLTQTVVAGSIASAVSGSAIAKPAVSTKVLGISCSTRKGMTTATALKEALNAAKAVDSGVTVELIDLAGMNIAPWGAPVDPATGQRSKDDFDRILPKIKDPQVGGIIIGSPVYFRSMTAVCKAFIERCAAVHKPDFLLTDKALGVLSVGGYRNGGQELVIEQIQSALLCHEVMVVGGKPGAFLGATLWNNYNDDITKDEFGMDTARKLGIRVAEAAIKIGQ